MDGRKPLALILETRANWHGENPTLPAPPALAKGDPIIAAAQAEAAQIRRDLAPVDKTYLAGRLYVLQMHYYTPDIEVSVMKEKAADYLRHLSNYPQKCLDEFYDRWLLNPDNKRFPLLSEINESLRLKKWAMENKLKKLEMLISRAV